MIVSRQYRWPFLMLTSLFALWGIANNMTDILLAAFKKVMSMSDFQTSWIQVAFYGAYFCLALPAALFIQKYSYKAGILLGLALYALGAGLCYPASLTMEYWHFLIAFYILACGCSILETAANPYILFMGDRKTAAQRLNLAQAFNPLGSICGILLGQYLILSRLDSASIVVRSELSPDKLHAIQTGELSAIASAYGVIAITGVLLWAIIFASQFPYASDNSDKQPLREALFRLWRNKQWVGGVIAQFFYVGAQIGIWSFTIRYVMETLSVSEVAAADYYFYSLIIFSISRFLCTGLMRFISAHKLLTILALVAAALTVVSITCHDIIGVYALIGISGCMSLMFPTIYSIALEDVGEDTKIAAAGLVMAVLGGAILTAVQGQLSDILGIYYAFIVPFISFLIIGYYSMNNSKNSES